MTESWMFWEGFDSKVKLSLYRTLLDTGIQSVSGWGKLCWVNVNVQV